MYDLLNEPVEIRLSRAKNKKSDLETLNILSQDRFWYVRNFVAANPSTSYETLNNLLHDDDFRVQFEAEKNLKKRGLSDRIAVIQNKREPAISEIIDKNNIRVDDKER